MNIKFFVNYPPTDAPLLVELKIKTSNQIVFQKTINLQDKIDVIDATFDILNFNQQTITAQFTSSDFKITRHQLVIKNIKLDNFYSLAKITHSASRKFDERFLTYAKKNKIFLDLTTTDDNCLNFTGSLVYTFIWPFFKNTINTHEE